MVTDNSPKLIEMASLRRELVLRMVFQNSLLIMSGLIFAIVCISAAALPTMAWQLAAVQNAVLLAASLQWCHHGVRIAQIKQFLVQLYPGTDSWESWLPAHRPATLLGSRWAISTKGVFVGLGLAVCALAILISPQFHPLAALLSMMQLLVSAGFLLTNIKE